METVTLIFFALAVALATLIENTPPVFQFSDAAPSSSGTMRALVAVDGGDGEEREWNLVRSWNLVTDHPKPVVLPDQILIETSHSALTSLDVSPLKGRPPLNLPFPIPPSLSSFLFPFLFPFLRPPKILGTSVAGTVAAIGTNVPSGKFAVGDRAAALLPSLHTRWGGAAD